MTFWYSFAISGEERREKEFYESFGKTEPEEKQGKSNVIYHFDFMIGFIIDVFVYICRSTKLLHVWHLSVWRYVCLSFCLFV